MPTATGGDTIGERLQKLRVDLTRVETTIARAESSGQSRDIGGGSVTEIAYERALESRTRLQGQILKLEQRLNGSAGAVQSIVLQTRMPS